MAGDRERIRSERLIASTVVVLLHVLLGWLLVRGGVVTLPVVAEDDASALQVVWIAPSKPVAVVPDIATAPPPRRVRRTSPTPTPVQTTPPDSAVAQAGNVAPSQPLSATFIEQGRRWARQRAAAVEFAPSPLADRAARLPGRDANRFRMRDPITPAVVVESIGKLFGGGPGDPCPRIRDNLANLGTGGDGALLREELRRRRSLCR